MQNLGRVAAAILALALVGYFLQAAAGALQNFDTRILLSPGLLAATTLMLVCYALVIPLSSWAWGRLLVGMGERHAFLPLLTVMAVSQFGKYLPGNVAHIAGRSALALAQGMGGRALLFSIGSETILAVLASVTVGISAFGLSAHKVPFLGGLHWGHATVLLGALAAILLLAWRTMAVKAVVKRILPRKVAAKGLVTGHGIAFAAYSANYFLIGLGLWAMAASIHPSVSADYWYLCGTFAFSWCLGLLAPGAPAGLGVREGAMMLLLAGRGQQDALLALIAAARVATLAGDAFWFGAGLWLLRRRKARNGVE